MDESIKEIILKLSNYIFWGVIIYLLRDSLSSLISNIKKLFFKKGNNELRLETKDNNEGIEKKEVNDLEKVEKIVLEKDLLSTQKEDKGFIDVIDAIRSNKLALAEDIFNEGNYSFFDECVYLYERYMKNDTGVINIFNERIGKLNDSEEKRTYIYWLAMCLKKVNDFDSIYELYLTNIEEVGSNSSKNKLKNKLAYFYRKNYKYDNAKNILIEILNNNVSNSLKPEVFSQLVLIEKELGNNLPSDLCKDKLAEVAPLDSSYLFESAYGLDESYKGLQLLNYEKLLSLDDNNAIALNNYGVTLGHHELNILSINSYKKSESLNYTLAMANKGYKLLHAGFYEEALEIATKATEFDDVHDNVYSLLDSVKTTKRNEEEKLEELRKKYEKYQINARQYIESYYSKKEFNRNEWVFKNELFDLPSNNDKDLYIKFIEENGNKKYEIELKGQLHNRTMVLEYKQKDLNSNGLLMKLDFSKRLIGYISESEDKFIFFAESEEDDYSLEFKRKI